MSEHLITSVHCDIAKGSKFGKQPLLSHYYAPFESVGTGGKVADGLTAEL